MTLSQLQYVVAIDQNKSFNKAAKQCFVTQPTLSIQVQKLEEELEVTIFDRDKSPVVPTEIGKVIIEQAHTILRESQRLIEQIHQRKKVIKGEYRLGIIPSVAGDLMPLFLKNFVNNYPDVTLMIQELKTRDLLQRLMNDQVDAGIAATPLQESQIIETPLYYEPFYLYVSKNHLLQKNTKVNQKDLKIDELWLLEEGHCFRNQVQYLCQKHRQVKANRNIHFESSNFENLIHLVDQNIGMTLLPFLTTQRLALPQQNNIREFITPVPMREISLVVRRSAVKQAITNALQQTIEKNLPQILKNFVPEKGRVLAPE